MTEKRTTWRCVESLGPWSAYSERNTKSSQRRRWHEASGLRQADANAGSVAAEATRIRLEVKTARAGGISVWPSVGREFDPYPDSGGELAYDALEKAYNLAFAIGDRDRLQRADVEETLRDSCNDIVENPTQALKARARLHRSILTDKTVFNKRERSTEVSSKVHFLNLHEQCANDVALVSVSGLAHMSSLRSRRKFRLYQLRELAEACRARVFWKTSHPGQKLNKMHRTSDLSLREVTPSMQSVDITESSQKSLTEVTPPDFVQVAHYLLDQLNNFALATSPSTSDQNLLSSDPFGFPHREHRRGLTDFTQNMARWIDKPYCFDSYCNGNAKDGKVQLQNPFQGDPASPDSVMIAHLNEISFSKCFMKVRHNKPSASKTNLIIKRLGEMYRHGWNAIIVREESKMLPEVIVQAFDVPGGSRIQLIVTEIGRITMWRDLLLRKGIRSVVLGEPIHAESPLVLMCTLQTFVEYASVAGTLLVDHFVVEVGDSALNQKLVASNWARVLSVHCRQRVLIVPPAFKVDLRVAVLFTFPAAMCSRQLIMAWNCTCMDKQVISGIANIVKLCAISFPIDTPVANKWILLLEETLTSSVANESNTLGKIIRQLGAIEVDNHVAEPGPIFAALDNMEHLHREGEDGSMLTIDENYESSADSLKAGSRSRKRIVRCGECVGCAASDCMSCGHCLDMKKYGGPGLRKQSCKRRKCVAPKLRGVKRRHASLDRGDKYDSDSGISRETTYSSAFSSASDESDDEYRKATLRQPLQSQDKLGHAESDEQSGDDTEIMLVEYDTSEDSDFSRPLARKDLDILRMRSRVTRCGECAGCTAVDCLTCIHCKDMKKYGGPGLRKQSCKYRKCISPKVVLLNQGKEEPRDLVLNRREGVNFDDVRSDSRNTAAKLQTHSHVGEIPRLDTLHLTQECLLLVRRFQFFKCDLCGWAFTSEIHLNRHVDTSHKQAPTAFPEELYFETICQHPHYHLACLLSSRKMINPSWSPPPVRAYAKLEGGGFEFYVMKTCTVLGRLDSKWIRFYQARGITNLLGLPGGSVDCHIGDDSMIAHNQAIIKWDSDHGVFTLECVNFRSVISVNGRDLHYTSHPAPLMSGDLLQIGACTFHFLLPRAASSSEASSSLSQSEVRTWLHQSLLKQRATQTQSEAIWMKIRAHDNASF